jgi:hypothetical protein
VIAAAAPATSAHTSITWTKVNRLSFHFDISLLRLLLEPVSLRRENRNTISRAPDRIR